MPHSELLIELEVSCPSRLDLLLMEALRQSHPHITRSQLKTAFRRADVQSGDRTLSASIELPEGKHSIRIRGLPPGPQVAPPARDTRLSEIYRDAQVLVLHKPSGLPSVPLSSEETETAVGAALAAYPELAGVGRGGLEPGILHRLDTGTSGALVFARDPSTYDALLGAWQSGAVRKIYRAIVSLDEAQSPIAANLQQLPFCISTPLGHDPKSSRKMIPALPGRKIRGKALAARTWIRAAREPRAGLLDLEIEIETGVMHQIRCHLASIGLPILGDELYGGKKSHRLWLHAWRLELPLGTQRILIQSLLPRDWPRAGA